MSPAEFLRIRLKMGMTREEIASFLNLSERTVRSYEGDERHSSSRVVHPTVALVMRWLDEGKVKK